MVRESLFNINIGKKKNLEFLANEKAFYPTGTSEFLIKSVCEKINKPGSILDLGCGVGIVGISLAKLGKATSPLYLSDASDDAIKLTNINADIHGISVDARFGSLYEPWSKMRFDYIIDDVSGISEEIAKISPWFKNVPCASGYDGSDLVIEVLSQAPEYLSTNGKIFFPILSLSNSNKILVSAKQIFKNVNFLARKTWPLPTEMKPHLEIVRTLAKNGIIEIEEKFGMIMWHTDIYEANNEN